MDKSNLDYANQYAQISLLRIFETYKVVRPLIISLVSKKRWWMGRKFRSALQDIIKTLDSVFNVVEPFNN